MEPWLQYLKEENSSEEEEKDSDAEEGEEQTDGPAGALKRTFGSIYRKLSGSDDAKRAIEKSKGRWVTFIDNIQRVLLFTLNKTIINKLAKGEKVENPKFVFESSLKFVGVSLVDDVKSQVVAYLALSPYVSQLCISSLLSFSLSSLFSAS